MNMQGPKTSSLFQKATDVIPYGVNSNFRYWGDDDTLVISRGEGTYVWDADGKRYIDYRLGFGPIILGHAYPEVVNDYRCAFFDFELGGHMTLFEHLRLEVGMRYLATYLRADHHSEHSNERAELQLFGLTLGLSGVF